MSGIIIQGNTSGTGTFTITAPNSDTSRTLTLPDVAGTVLTSGSNADFPAGSVLQVVQGTTTTEISESAGTETDTTLSAAITPSSTSSKILVMVSHGTCQSSNASAGNRIGMKLFRDSTEILYPITGVGYTISSLNQRDSISFNYLDSPSTTSAVTYKTKFWNQAATATVTMQVNNADSTIVLMEIAG